MLAALKSLPIVRTVLAKRYERYFAAQTNGNHFRGVYADFAAARAAIPAARSVGSDHPEPAAMYADRLDRVFTSDYPMLYWLSRLAPSVRQVFDFGGHVGIAYYAYQRYLPTEPAVHWTVYDVPAVVAAGCELAARRGASRLRFTSDYADAADADILMASGAFQYVGSPTPRQLLAGLRQRPRYLLINKAPLHPTRSFVTVQNFGTGFAPYRIFHRDAFLADLAAAGYRLLDEWRGIESCHVPHHPGHSIAAYTGLCLERLDS